MTCNHDTLRNEGKTMQSPTHAVIEKAGENYGVTLHRSPEAAEDYAAALATENTSYTEQEIRENLKHRSSHEEGDYGVFLANATCVGMPEQA